MGLIKDSLYRKKINVIIVFLWIILTSIILSLSFISAKSIVIDSVDENGYKAASQYSKSISNWINNRIISIKAYANTPTAKSMDINNIVSYLSDESKRNEDVFKYMFVSDVNGNYKTTLNHTGNIKEKYYFQKALNKKVLFTKPLKFNNSNKLVNLVLSPIENNGDIVGIIGGVVDTDKMINLINGFRVDHVKSYSYIVDKTGITIAHPYKNNIMKENISIISDKVNDDIKKASKEILNKNNGSVKYTYEDLETYAYFNLIANTENWILVTRIPSDYINKPIKEKLYSLLIIGTISMIVLGILSTYISYRIYERRVKIEEDVKIKEKQLQDKIESDNLKTEFLANISHELKTPLNMIFSSVQLSLMYAKNDNNDNSKKHLNIIKQNSYRLLRLVDNLIDITRIDSGFMTLNLENKDIIKVIEDITMSTVQYVENKNRVLRFDTNIEELIMAIDCDKIERIILNLISNSIKFTSEGDIIEINILYNMKYIEVSVKDTGIGIDENKTHIIFERFRQIEPLLNRKNEGSGLGLPLVKSLVEMHEGNIKVNNEYKDGAEFIIKLPVKLVDEKNIDKVSNQSKVEKINIEFSDIYS